ncbi:heat shock transcription factor, X-linked member 4-like [Nasonia vitripennis]|uniref:HSF-type DNA-binding domain-containing protein n=1 Tax=Nasonia vitripennis TaxID=7425 RepID=A0A7M7GIL0_NASVI|nr:heat shock transcription factor, X-linked member 4-like [Nasonia vitripennis]
MDPSSNAISARPFDCSRIVAPSDHQESKLFEYVIVSNEAQNSKVDQADSAIASDEARNPVDCSVSETSTELTSEFNEATSRADSSGDNFNSIAEVNNAFFDDSCNAIPSLRFPQKLWRIVNECRSGAIGWGPDGLSVLVDYDSFQREYLNGSDSGIFKTSNMASFIRQLNLYGFRKLTSHNRDMFGAKTVCVRGGGLEQKVHEFLHENFRQGRLDLLSRVCRKTGVKKNSQLARQAKLLKEARMMKIEAHETRGTGMTRLQRCQLALTEALAQATRQYHMEKKLWLNLTHNNTSDKDPLDINCKRQSAEPLKIEILFQDLSQLQNVESMPIIDAAGLENVIDNQERIQWSEFYTLPGENGVTISVPYL